MCDALVSEVLRELISVIERQVQEEVKLVVGVDKEIEKLTSALQSIGAVLVDAEKRQIKQESVKVWLEKLKDVSYDIDDVLSEWFTAILNLHIQRISQSSSNTLKKLERVRSFFTFPCLSFSKVVLRRDIALKIKDLNERLDVIATEKDRYNFTTGIAGGDEHDRPKTISFVDVSEVRGRDRDKDDLVTKLCVDNICPLLISLVGMGGIGKTTLAQLAYNSDEVVACFEKRIWVCVSDPFDELRVAKAIVEGVEGDARNFVELEAGLRHVRRYVEGKKFLLVLDDVWTEEVRKWEPLRTSLKDGARGSKILVTTRNERVARMMASSITIHLGILWEQDCWSLFSHIAFFERSKEECEELQDIGRQIANKCKGLPLAAKTIGSLMRFKNTRQDWQNVLDNDMWELEEAEKGLFPPLLLSYNDLPSTMQRCFSYCATIPKDHKIETDNLIKLWMAQGYLNSRGSVDMEIVGREYLEILAMRSFFQDLEKDKHSDKIIRFKMHDMVHDFATFLTKKECFIMEAGRERKYVMNQSCNKCRHLTLIRAEEVSFPLPTVSTEKLHSFWVQCFYDCPPIVSNIDRIQPDLFDRLTRLRALDLSRNNLPELPTEVGKLWNMRYLNLSHNPISVLPETVCDLYNLQTLKLVACNHLSKLPEGMGKLINLRHLEIDRTDKLRAMPEGIGKLGALRTLSKLVISSGDGNREASCRLGDLGNLNHLGGCLNIEGLGHVTDAGEAQNSELKSKNHLLDLHLNFNPIQQDEGTTNVLEALQPHPNLQSLQISTFGGSRLPDWIMLLTNLRKLKLQDCSCIQLPPLGKLPCLERLHVECLDTLKCLSSEFLALDIDQNDDSLGPSLSTSVIVAFPKLKKLKIAYMKSWKTWEMMNTRIKLEENIKIMPCLRHLKLSHCNKLKALPQTLLQMAPLRKLHIDNSPVLLLRYQKGKGEDWTKISHIPKIRIS